MNRLEQRIFKHISGMLNDLRPEEAGAIARIAASICLEVAEKAYDRGGLNEYHGGEFEDFKREIL